MDAHPVPKPALASGTSESEMSGFVHLGSVHDPARSKGRLIQAARPVVPQTPAVLQRTPYALLVEMEDGGWLSVASASAALTATDDRASTTNIEGDVQISTATPGVGSDGQITLTTNPQD